MQNLKLVLDLWNWYIKWVIFAEENQSTIVVAKEIVKTSWMRKWKILDIDDFVYSIRELFDSFEKKLWWDYIEEVYVWISHPDMYVKRIKEQKRIVNEKISQDDMDHLSNLVYDTSSEANYETIKIIPVQWIIDENMNLKDPVDMEWKKLELLADIFMIPKNFYNSLLEVFEKLEIEVGDIVPNILGSVEAAMDFDTKDLWAVLVDIWTNQTSFVVYEEWIPLKYWIVPMWAEDVTKDISIWLQLDIKAAETIKKEKWTISLDDSDDQDEEETIDVKFLTEVVSARYEEIFDKINEELIEIGKDARLPWGIILVGWWSKIYGLDILAKQQFKLACFYGTSKLSGYQDLWEDLQYINLIGAYLWCEKYSEKEGWFGIWSKLWFDWLKRMIRYIKDMF